MRQIPRPHRAASALALLFLAGCGGGCNEDEAAEANVVSAAGGTVANAADPTQRLRTPDGYEVIQATDTMRRQHEAQAERRRQERERWVLTPTTPDPENGEFTLEEAVVGLPTDGSLVAEIDTTLGTIFCDLFADKVPNTVANFTGLARGTRAWWDPRRGEWRRAEPYYDGTLFHRVIPGYLIQGGDLYADGSGNPGYSIPDEPHPEMTHDRAGLLCMASSAENENGAQFFITDGATPDLDADTRYTIFGRCRDLEIVERIARVPQTDGNRPMTDVEIERLRVRRVAGGAANAVRTPPQLPDGVTPEEFYRHASPGPGELWDPAARRRREEQGEDPLDPRTFRPPGGERQRLEE
ncbi:MAG: peptidylprolyl isomerase [Sandaracinus sp.]|nr:peptidylprolyl isomerase [Sandaracinus sp.]MCB9614370.1 peptidylprolyl isomerase [Sandaracinus sp.]